MASIQYDNSLSSSSLTPFSSLLIERASLLVQVYVEHANKAAERFSVKSLKLSAAKEKLQSASDLLETQIMIASQFVSHVGKRSEVVDGLVEALHAQQDAIEAGFNTVLSALQQQQLASEFAESSSVREMLSMDQSVRVQEPLNSNESGSVKSDDLAAPPPLSNHSLTLYDFVDVESVTSLKQRVLAYLEEMLTLRHRCKNIGHMLHTRLDRLTQIWMNSKNTESSLTDPVKHDSTSSANYVAALESILRDIALTSKDEEMSAIQLRVQKAYDVLQQHLAADSELETGVLSCHSCYQQRLTLLSELEQFGVDIRASLLEFDALEYHVEARRIGAMVVAEECANLIAWYQHFLVSYHQLVDEVKRRHDVLATLQGRIYEVVNEFACQHDAEEAIRDEFHDKFGQFLPPALCPEIDETAPIIQVIPLHLFKSSSNINRKDIIKAEKASVQSEKDT